MRSTLKVAFTAALTLASASGVWAKPEADPSVAAPPTNRPKADTDRDALHKAGEILEYSGAKPGQVAVDLLPGGGYFTRLFSRAVGPGGVIYGVLFRPPTRLRRVTRISSFTRSASPTR
jgi:predicted methyltransferase